MTPGNAPSVLGSLRQLAPGRPLRYPEALRVAEQQANYLLEVGDVMGPPIPMELITGLPRIHVELHPHLPVAGSSHWADGRWIIRLSMGDHPRRRRFTLAHEFKHIIDHRERAFLYAGFHPSYRRRQVERIADAFAAALLMPKVELRRAFFEGMQDPYDLARLFDVSPAAIRVRLNQLGLVSPGTACGRQPRHPSITYYHGATS